MKFILTTMIAVASLAACKSHKPATAQVKPDTTSVSDITAPAGTSVGRVSHQYSQGGCPVVIIVSQDGGDLVLIPKDALSQEFDKDGLEIRFNYRTLKMPQPAGCAAGIPAELTDISQKK